MAPKKNRVGIGSACGKVILLGEHAVVHGEPAMAFPFPESVEIELRPGSGKLTIHAPGISIPSSKTAALPRDIVQAALGKSHQKLDTAVVLNVPPMSGFGSSAALAVSLLRAHASLKRVPLSDDQLLKAAIKVERTAHGRPSGLDPAAIIENRLVWFEKKKLVRKSVRFKGTFWFVVTHAGQHSGAQETINRLETERALFPRVFSSLFETLGEISRDGRKCLERGQKKQLGALIDLAHGILRSLGVVDPGVEELTQIAKSEGALGAKMSGAGGTGGALLALASSESNAQRIRSKFLSLNFPAWAIRL